MLLFDETVGETPRFPKMLFNLLLLTLLPLLTLRFPLVWVVEEEDVLILTVVVVVPELVFNLALSKAPKVRGDAPDVNLELILAAYPKLITIICEALFPA